MTIIYTVLCLALIGFFCFVCVALRKYFIMQPHECEVFDHPSRFSNIDEVAVYNAIYKARQHDDPDQQVKLLKDAFKMQDALEESRRMNELKEAKRKERELNAKLPKNVTRLR